MIPGATGGGTFDPTERPIYFLACVPVVAEHAFEQTPYILLPLNKLMDATGLACLERLLDGGARILLDSGIFWLANEHAKAHGLSMDQALSAPPEEVDGFAELWDHYLRVVRRFEERLWGYIELDQGGAHNTRRTRERLLAEGLRPIPVYHPLNDGWDYFDELAEGHDRVCFGNVVKANRTDRAQLCATAYERTRRHPGLWVHLLGIGTGPYSLEFPTSSCDASSWIYPVAFGLNMTAMMGVPWNNRDPAMLYDPDQPAGSEAGYHKAERVAAMEAAFFNRGWAEHQAGLAALGRPATPWPEPERVEVLRVLGAEAE